jgi:hypothetical protein
MSSWRSALLCICSTRYQEPEEDGPATGEEEDRWPWRVQASFRANASTSTGRDYAPGFVLPRNLRRVTSSARSFCSDGKWNWLNRRLGLPLVVQLASLLGDREDDRFAREKQRERNDGSRVGREFPPRGGFGETIGETAPPGVSRRAQASALPRRRTSQRADQGSREADGTVGVPKSRA